MSGQVNLVSGEKVVCVSCPGHSYICANFQCNNFLTDYELAKIAKLSNNTRTRSKNEYCRKCRKGKHFDKVRCNHCLRGFNIETGRTSTAKYCRDCKTERHRTAQKKVLDFYQSAIVEERPDRFCRVCGKKTPKRHLDCSKKCTTRWHRDVRRKNNQEMIDEIKANRFCALESCGLAIATDADFRVRFCTPECKKIHHRSLFKLYRARDKQIALNKGLVSV
jgi:predicted nucleic acid-binding Zn ribbon protein